MKNSCALLDTLKIEDNEYKSLELQNIILMLNMVL